MYLFSFIFVVILALTIFISSIVDIKYQYRYKVNRLLSLERRLKSLEKKCDFTILPKTSAESKKYLKLSFIKFNLIDELETILKYKEIIK